METKRPFDAMKAVHLTHSLSASDDKGEAGAILQDWRAYLKDNFDLTGSQRSWLDSVDEERDAEVKTLLREVVESSGAERLIVAMIADHSKPGGLYHELRKESVEESRQGLRPNLVIAHCDANCENWGWGSG
jgi:hypothetical protein